MDRELIISLHDGRGVVKWLSEAPPPATVEEVLGSRPWDWVPAHEQSRVKQLFAACIALGEPQHFAVNAMVHGTLLPLDVRVDPTGGTALPAICRVRVIDSKVSLLSERERLVLQMTGAGASSKDIARRMRISRSTVDTLRSRARSKLGIKTLAGLAVWANRNLS